ncbi:LADA_0G05996g1_1 [Lachancea dasiensis]|uniref:Diphthine--ammonia ligase n=1 Tax=Lachancea dasiensis TaxID=1072105 RepID=A0A1G4JT16_9SACH|nr:LADA_0G05996g1_1 [Lachancea dasiensis]
MKFIALVSGGKDSCYSILHSIRQGHELVALGNLHPGDVSQQELDSFMFQTVGHDVVTWYEKCTGLPLIRRHIHPQTSKNVSLNYYPTEEDEIEDLYELLKDAKRQIPELEAVNAGAILSSYQRTRVENVCNRLQLTPLSYLWQRDQEELMTEMCSMSKRVDCMNDQKMDARLIKTAAVGLDQSSLGKSLPQVFPLLQKLSKMFEVHICGEGGEFETMVFDAPFFTKGYLEPHLLEVDGSESLGGVYNSKIAVKFIERTDSISMVQALQDLPVPPALGEMWIELAREIEVPDVSSKSVNCKTEQTVAHNPVVSVRRVGTQMYISNLRPRSGNSPESKTNDVFEQLDSILDKNGFSASQILSASLLLDDMSNFGAINSVYNEYFQVSKRGPLPPARACVGSSAVGATLQLSVIIDTEATVKKFNGMVLNETKSGLHVQGRSYWAPCNIGPYSQAIWKKNDVNQVSFISGQIALDPASMVLTGALDEGLTEDTSQVVLSLRHFDTLKETVGAPHQVTMVCFVSEASLVPMISKVWSLYSQGMRSISENWMERPSEDPRSLMIVKVSELPRQAKCEWGGIACRQAEALSDDYTESDEENNGSTKTTIPSLPQQFEYYRTSVINSSRTRHYYTGYIDSHSELVSFLGELQDAQMTVYHRPTDDQLFDNTKTGVELFPVENVYDSTGRERLFGFQLIF